MTTLFDLAIETARLLPPEKQDEIARLVLEMARDGTEIYHLSPAEQVEIDEALKEVERGDLVDEATARTVLARFAR